jgi:hypothetical protein
VVAVAQRASAYYIWRQLTALALAGQANVSERLASQSIEILKYIADDPPLYDYLYENKPLSDETLEWTKVLCCAEIMANFLEHIVIQKPSLPKAFREAWMLYVRDHYKASFAVRDLLTHHRDWYGDVFLKLIDAAHAGSLLDPAEWYQESWPANDSARLPCQNPDHAR